MLSSPWAERQPSYDFIVIGSGYGGAITAARISTATGLSPKPSVCILERGREWEVGKFPDSVDAVLGAARSDTNPLGLYEFLNYDDISVIKGSGLGGTSLINANVAIVPDEGVFALSGWPRTLKYSDMLDYYDRARATLAAGPHPQAVKNPSSGERLKKVQALERRAQEISNSAEALNIAVNFTIKGKNEHGVEQQPCTDCGDCVTGCNVGAKNTLYMNYLPMAKNAGAKIFTQSKVEWIEKLDGGQWRIHGKHYSDKDYSEGFTMTAGNVFLCAGSLNSTEILMRSEMHGLSVSPALGTCFSGNGDFFGLAYNTEYQTDVLGYGTRNQARPSDAFPPGPSITGVIKYNGKATAEQRISIEDFSFPSAYLLSAKAVFAAIRGDDTIVGNEDTERRRRLKDLNILDRYAPDGALNHTMLYLVMGQDDARGTMVFDAPWHERDGRMRIQWDKAGQQLVFTRINEELRRHARALEGSYIVNPMWSVFQLRHLVTAHPLGGCPMGEDYLHGAVDEFGRVFSGDGSVHNGLFVTDGAIVRSALNVNPFLTISALTERVAERKIQDMQGNAYPKPGTTVSMTGLDPLEVLSSTEGDLERLFRRCPTMGIDVLLNSGAEPVIDKEKQAIYNDRYWKGFFAKGHVLNLMSSAIFTGFKKEFHKEGVRYVGITSDTDGRIRARNLLEEVSLPKPTGTLEAGKYILLSYPDPPWTGFYDILKIINENLIIGRVYLGQYPNGIRQFTFAMSRKYGFAQLTVDDHAALFADASVPTPQELSGVWRMDVVSNNNHLGSAAWLQFDSKPDGRVEARYQLMGLMEGLVIPSFVQNHFQLNDFTSFHDEIRKLDADTLIGKYVTELPAGLASLPGGSSLGVLQQDGNRVGFYYMLTRSDTAITPTSRLLAPFLDSRLPDGVGMTFDEEMAGWYEEGGDKPRPDAGVDCSFRVKMIVRDVNEFVDGSAHEASLKGTIMFAKLHGQGPRTFTLDESRSLFHYLRENPGTGEAEMNYHLEFRSDAGQRYLLAGRKYMQKDRPEGDAPGAVREVLADYTTLYCEVMEMQGGSWSKIGTAYLKFRTFEDLAAVGNLAGFLTSFQITGTSDPRMQLQARLRFLAFTGQFVQREYDPLALPVRRTAAG